MSVSGNQVSGYLYGDDGRLEAVTSGSRRVEYSYETDSNLVAAMNYQTNGSNVLQVSKTYDTLNRVETVTGVAGAATVASFDYENNTLSQRTRIDLADGSYWVYGYNANGEVVSGIKYDNTGTPISGQSFGYQFDGIGNRELASVDSTQTDYSANLLNEYTEIDPGTPVVPAYDADGNLLVQFATSLPVVPRVGAAEGSVLCVCEKMISSSAATIDTE